MGNNSILHDDFVRHVERLKIAYKGSSINPFKFHKHVEGKQIPVYFIGAPGLYTAIIATLLAITYMLAFTLKSSWYIWLLIIVFSAFMLRISFKIDKARQIRMFSSDMVVRGYESLKLFSETGEEKYLKDATFFLEESSKWVDEPIVGIQLEKIRSLTEK